MRRRSAGIPLLMLLLVGGSGWFVPDARASEISALQTANGASFQWGLFAGIGSFQFANAPNAEDHPLSLKAGVAIEAVRGHKTTARIAQKRNSTA